MKESKEIKEFWYKDNYTTIHHSKNPKIQTLLNLYNKDKYKARIYYMNDTSSFIEEKLILFTKKNGDFSLIRFTKTYGISISNKIYNRETRTAQLHFSKNKFTLITKYPKQKQYIINPSFQKLNDTFYRHNNQDLSPISLLIHRFSWIKFIQLNPHIHNISLNTFINKKLYSLKDALRFKFKMPYPTIKLLINNNHSPYITDNIIHYLKYIDNIQNLNPEFITTHTTLFYDALKMAKTVDKKLNASWSTKRLKLEHDNWAKIITDVMFVDANRIMKINQEFIEFAKFSNYTILTTTSEMAYEGKRMNHCVATYVSKVESERAAIYSVNNHTLELNLSYDFKTHNYFIVIAQLKGYNNQNPPQELLNEITIMVNNYNNLKNLKNHTQTITVHRPIPTQIITDDFNFPF